MRILKYTFHAVFYLYIALVLFASLYSFNNTKIDLSEYLFGLRVDRIVHYILFLPYSVNAWLAFGSSLKKYSVKYAQLYTLLSGILVSSMTEYLQTLTPYRDFDLLDLSSNYLGIISGSLIVYLLNKYAKNVWPGRLQ
ncbi:MAG: VanZ family protein [Bacteroidales bacterium]